MQKSLKVITISLVLIIVSIVFLAMVTRTIVFTGTTGYNGLEGGFYCSISDSGEGYVATIPPEYEYDGQRVFTVEKITPNQCLFIMWSTIIELV